MNRNTAGGSPDPTLAVGSGFLQDHERCRAPAGS